ncbi:MAG: DUF2341 domain-containing protein, partial [Candidatus Methanoperedens sp.]|nr:DUF2341 domain-containing protein [Candidatus Methanoperedens sp.]
MVSNNLCIWHAFRVAFGITVLVILLAGGAGALSNDGGGSWQYYRNVTITNTGYAQTDYQVMVNLTGSDFPASANISGADIRFTEMGGAELSYWIEEWDHANRSGRVWVNVTSVPAGGSTSIRMYYGNPSAISSSNGNATFVFFDDFEDGTLNKWDEVDPGQSVFLDNGNHVLRLFSDSSLWKGVRKNIVPTDIRVDLKYKIVQNGDWDGARFVSDLRTGYRYMLADWHFLDDARPERYLLKNDAHLVDVPVSYYSILGEWYYWGFSVVGSSSVELKGYGKYGENLTSFTDTINPLISGQLRLWVLDAGATDYVDDVRVRKYASPEPSVSVGAETPNTPENFTFVHLTDVHIGYYPWENSKNITYAIGNFTDTLQTLKKVKPDFILITGDLVEYDNKDFFIAFKNLLRGSSITVKGITPGNHDRRDTYYGLLGNNLSDYNKYIKPISNPDTVDNNYSFDYKGYRFIGIDSGADYSSSIIGAEQNATISIACPPLICDNTPESDGLSDEQMMNLRGEFNNTYPKIVFMHHPVMNFGNDTEPPYPKVPHDGAPGGNDGAIAFNRWNFINYTKESNVKLVLTGHSHYDAIFNIYGKPDKISTFNRPLFI